MVGIAVPLVVHRDDVHQYYVLGLRIHAGKGHTDGRKHPPDTVRQRESPELEREEKGLSAFPPYPAPKLFVFPVKPFRDVNTETDLLPSLDNLKCHLCRSPH